MPALVTFIRPRLGGMTALAALAAVAAALALAAPASAAPQLQVGVGRADITPPTGYYMMGWVRSDAKAAGQHTRLWARVIVLERGNQKVALVAEDLGGIPGGMLAEAAERVSELGFSQRNVLDSASHTHAAPTGFFNFATFNTVFMTINSPTDFQLTGGLDPQLYAFMVRRLALAIRRADANLGPGKLGWGKTQITDLTDNRSLEAHLRNHGIHEDFGEGSASQDPQGRLHTLDPDVNVLRVDKTIGGRQVPVGMWSTFADHGTVNRFQFTYYNRDHHGAATQLVEDAIRRAGQVPPGQEVVNAYGNTDEGDQTAGLHRAGPAAADHVGRVEAKRVHARLARGRRAHERNPGPGRAAGRGCAGAASRPPPGRSPTRGCSACRSSPAPRRAAGRSSTSPGCRSRATTSRSARAPRASRSRPRSRSTSPTPCRSWRCGSARG